ncbi:heparinase II/III family protein [Aliiroseovarius sediminis]|uniref:heparinase II/III family protein n=1 Tax=Aliiroseovarius sediminis TaxID=2925839 RepID=UPI001F573C24|nr:heparinase II/III family protein [uncultured Aliiroseovarius sp.]MCI2394884.1 heparinase II/III family protein [Aliiroseovarius sediminis]
MVHQDGFSGFKTRFANRWQAKRAARARPATGFVSQPEPRTIGAYARGKQLIAGNYLFAGHLVNAPDANMWDITPPSQGYSEETQGFVWLDDLASVGDSEARKRAQAWVLGWIERYGRGVGDGWTPDLTGRRLIRWINHAIFLMAGMDSDQSRAFFRSLGQQTIFLSRRWHAATPGLPRFEALTGLIYAGLGLEGMERHVAPAVKALARECADQIDAEGGIPTRNPEELLDVFTLLNWAAQALSESGRQADPAHVKAIKRIAPTLRALRHADGGLARFHGGGRGLEGRLDHALASSGVRARPFTGLAMGYTRLNAGRSSLIMDTARPPTGLASANAHASTLAFELTSGRRPLIVNCGSGAHFGAEWHKAGRATPSHSVLGLAGLSSSRLGAAQNYGGGAKVFLTTTPAHIHLQRQDDATGTGIGVVAAHDGYVASHGLTHMRRIELSPDGRGVSGEDTLAAVADADQARFDRAMDQVALQGVQYHVRFHLHPDVDATLDLGGTAVSMALRSGEIWVFRFEGRGELTLEGSVYLEKTRLKPRKTKQVVLSGVAMDYATRIRWTLAKAQETPSVLRDLERGDVAELPS